MKAVRNGLVLSVVAALATTVSAQTSYTGTGGPITGSPIGCGDVNSVATNFGTINIAGSPNATNVSIDLVGLNHTWVGDLDARVTGPGGFATTLFDRPGTSGAACGNSADFVAANMYRWDNSGVLFPEVPSNPIPSSTWRPTGDLGVASTALPGTPAGVNVNGAWNLAIRDWSGGDTGGIASWRINVTEVPEPASLGLLAIGALAMVRRRR